MFGAAFLYNRFVLKQRGGEQVPFAGAVGFVKDIVIISGIVRFGRSVGRPS